MSTTKSRTTKTRTRKTPEQRAAEARELHDTLTAQVEALVEDSGWQRYLDFIGSFHAYSLNNLMLILAQAPNASLVAGFRQWQQKGRQVRKGERAIKIRGYSTKKIEVDEAGETSEKVLTSFPILSVFDIAQTDPIEGVDQPESPAQRLSGDDHAGIYDAMAAHLTARGWDITRQPIAGETNGYTAIDGSRRIIVDADLSPAQAAKTLLHEAGHAILHADEDGKGDVKDYIEHRGLRECEAESVAYVLAGLVGMDTSAYSVGYVTSWTNGDVDAVRGCAENVLRAVHELAPALTGGNDSDEEAAA